MSASDQDREKSSFGLVDGSAVAVVGGGAAGSFFSIFLLTLAERMGLDLKVDLYEPKDFFTQKGPTGCNMCGGIISESLVQMLATEGINLPTTVVQRGIDAYELHTDVGGVRIETPLQEQRIAAVHRGAGPRNAPDRPWRSFDGFLQEKATDLGAQVRRELVNEVEIEEGRPAVITRAGERSVYDLLVIATGVNTATLKKFQPLNPQYKVPQTAKTMIREYYLGEEKVNERLGNSMHLFLMNIPRLEFAAIIPKGDCASMCLMGEGVDRELLNSFLERHEVNRCVRDGDAPLPEVCGCSPKINTVGAATPYADRVVFIGDAGVTRLYKDGIGAAYRTAKAAALTAIFHGVSAADFARTYRPACRKIAIDNRYGRLIFFVTDLIKSFRFAQRAVVRMVTQEQAKAGGARRMSMVLWDTFTGSAPYKQIFWRTFHPLFLLGLLRHLAGALFVRKAASAPPVLETAVN